MLTVFKLVNKYFWKGIMGPIFAFMLPLILLIFLGLFLGHEFYLPGGVAVCVLTIGLVCVPQSIFEFKNSTLLKRIGTTPINPMKFLFVVISFNLIIMFLSILLVFIFSFLVFMPYLNEAKNTAASGLGENYVATSWLQLLSSVDWGSFLFSTFLLICLTMVVGILLASVAKSTLFIQGIGITLMNLAFFVAPAVLPIGMTAQIEGIKYVSYLLPFKYPVSLMIESFHSFTPDSSNLSYFFNLNNSNIWDINSTFDIWNTMSGLMGKEPSALTVFEKHDKILNLVMPFVFIVIFGYFALGKFSWSARSSAKMNWNIFSPSFVGSKNVANNNDNNLHQPDLNSNYLIESHNVTKKFVNGRKEFIANNNININFKAGENVAILGSNGSGKTTFVEMMVGLNKPTSGYFKYNYETNVSFQESLGIQFQDSSYPVGLKCRDIVLFLKEAYNEQISNEELDKLINEFGINKFYKKNAHSLSGGEQQRLNLLLAIMHKPKLVFLDELSTGLDIKVRSTIKRFVKKWAQENNVTIVLVSHDMSEVNYLTERIIVLEEGKVVVDKMKSEILDNHKNLETFLEQYL